MEIAFFRSANGPAYETHYMIRDDQGVWEYSTNKRMWNKYYGYFVQAENGKGDIFNQNTLIPDPYSKVVSTQNNYHINARTFIYKDGYDWEGDTWVKPKDPRDLIIYETHRRALTSPAPTSALLRRSNI
jgi:1,4-alpha-glucan branching enzyme